MTARERLEVDVAKLDLRPGDTVVLTLRDRHGSGPDLRSLAERYQELIEQGLTFIVLMGEDTIERLDDDELRARGLRRAGLTAQMRERALAKWRDAIDLPQSTRLVLALEAALG